MMARDPRRLIAGSLFFVFLLRTSASQSRQFGYFNGTSYATLPNSQWSLRNWTQISFRTCNSTGDILRQTSSTGDQMLQVKLHNGSLEFHWKLNDTNNSVIIGSRLNNNTWYTCDLKYYLGSLLFQVSEVTPLFSQTVANSTYFSYLLDVRLQGTDLTIGNGFIGCLFSGVGINMSRSDLQTYGVRWDTCPLTNQSGCLPGDEDGDDCWRSPCLQGTCVDGYKNFTCHCPHNYNGTLCENDLSYLGCDLVDRCLNNGTCEPQTGQGTNYRCHCVAGYTGLNCEKEIDECRQHPCENHGRCIDQLNAYRCNCTGTGYTGSICNEDINECLSDPHPCGNGSCSNRPGTFSCVCGEGFEGVGCLKDVDECLSTPCQHGGNCTSGVNTYYCACPPGYSGMDCDVDIDDCVNVTCIGDNTKCIDQLNGYTCVCKDGYTGLAPICNDIDECAQNPCYYGATCHNLENDYSCSCPRGYNGTQCEININECDPNPCENNGTCVDGVDSYSCECVPGFRGDNCTEDIQECIEENVECQNGATCKDGINTFVCECGAGWTGTYCNEDINECDSNPCLNGGTCDHQINNFTCSCPTGFDGLNCSININDCDPDPCQNGGSCIDDNNNYNCSCTQNWMGKNCTVTYDACVALSPCLNGGACQTVAPLPSHVYNCTCPAGFGGTNCENNVDDCVGHTCPPHEQCYDGVGNYTCGCRRGFTGVNCSMEINECANDPCQNGGTCHDGIGEYTCTCVSVLVNLTRYTPGRKNEFLSGWTGKDCDVDINECNASVPACLSDGICRNNDGGYTCYCGPGSGSFATGFNCESTSSYCSIKELEIGRPPCQNGGTCFDTSTGDRINCVCAPGYTGNRCQTDIDECQTNPCQHNGTCNDDVNGYNCSCIPGITGDNCEININECWPVNPCLNYGICNDRINAYECSCTNTGFNGTQCQHNIDDCVGVTCMHGGTCVDGVKDYDCACFAGYTGKLCETDIDECLSSPCQYNGTCVQRSDQIQYGRQPGLDNFSYATAAGYICNCIPGITGPDCDVNIDDCENHPCANGATCVDKINAFECKCAPGFEGEFCRTDINECQLYRACRNGATCEDRIADYYCRCPAFQKESTTYGGKNCTVVLTGCNSNVLCQNGATCIPNLVDEVRRIHNYTCLCSPGYRGDYCNVSTTMSFAGGAKIVKENVQNFQLQLRFRTTLKSAMLLVYKPNSGDYISVEIKNEHLHAVFGGSTRAILSRPVPTRSTVNDALMHTITVIIKQNITLKVESSMCNSREECTVSFSFPKMFNYANPKLYIGNVEHSLNMTLSGMAFTGCMEDIEYNDHDFLMLSRPDSAVYTDVRAGCSRTEQCDPYTCNRKGDCNDLWNTFRCDCNRPFLGLTCREEYTPATFYKDNVRSWASFTIPSNYQANLQDSITLSLFVRTRQTDGVIMYFGSTRTASRTFIALEMRGGKLAAQFYFCNTSYPISSTEQYNNGVAQFVKLEMTPGNFTFSVNHDILNNQHQFRDVKQFAEVGCTFDAQVAYFGGKVPDISKRRRRATDPLVTVGDFSNISYFQGIIQDVEVNGIKLQFYPVNTTGVDSLNMSSSTNLTQGQESTEQACDSSPCEQNATCTNEFYNDFRCDCPFGYRGKNCSELDFCRNATCRSGARCQSLHNGYECISSVSMDGINDLITYNAVLNPSTTISSMSLKLRTGVLYGTLLYIQHGAYFMKLRVADGEIQLNYKLKDEISYVLNVHHKINDGTQYKVKVTLQDSLINMQVLNGSIILGEASRNLENSVTDLTRLIKNGENIYVGSIGQPHLRLSWEQPYKGCLEEVRLGGFLLPFDRDNTFENNNMRTEYFSAQRVVVRDHNCTYIPPSPNVYRNPGVNGATCEILWNGELLCTCPPGFTGTLCEENINDCTNGACFNWGVCVDGVESFTCKCKKGHRGNRCQEDVNFCNGTVCTNNGSCREEASDFVCDCTSDYTGITCNTSLNQACSTGLCQNGGTCHDVNRTISSGTVSSFNCTCAAGYEGPLCERPVDYCADLPCGAHGNCTSNPDTQDYTCSCEPGYTGKPCAVIDECATVGRCQNGGTCVGLNNNYTCNCTDAWVSRNCEVDFNECDINPCQHGQCDNRPGSFFCDCTGTGYGGDHCSDQVNECEASQPPCRNGGNCTDTEGSYNCSCTLGYEGKNCEIPDCDAGQCLNGGTCNVNGSKWICQCAKYYEGTQCEVAGPCLNQTCDLDNTAECIQDVEHNNYTCSCKTGWEGDNCTVNIDECALSTDDCENGATCSDTPGSYDCICREGFTGIHCETNIDDCLAADCQNNGVCEDLVNGFRCNCSGTGYKGDKCTVDIDECETVAPCTGNTNCINTDGGYDCQCKEGFIGNPCVKNPCTDIICQHGQCNFSRTDEANWVGTCVCTEGYEGSRCEKRGAVAGDDGLNIWYIIGPVIAVVLLIIIIGVVIFVMMARTKRATRGTYSPSRQETSGARVELGNVLKKPPEERLI